MNAGYHTEPLQRPRLIASRKSLLFSSAKPLTPATLAL